MAAASTSSYKPRVDPPRPLAQLLHSASASTSTGEGAGSGAAAGAAAASAGRGSKASTGNGPADGGSAEALTRLDGRALHSFRRIYVKVGAVSQAAGSAYVEVGRTKVVCSVFGPRAQARASEYGEGCRIVCDLKFAPFAQDLRRERRQGLDEKQLAILVRQAVTPSIRLDLYPKSVIDINVMVLESGGGALGAAITSASLALADAGIELFDLMSACSVAGVLGHLLVDPSAEEEARAESLTTMALMPALGEVAYTEHSGQLDVSGVTEGMSLCMDGCATLYGYMRGQLIVAAQRKAAATA